MRVTVFPSLLLAELLVLGALERFGAGTDETALLVELLAVSFDVPLETSFPAPLEALPVESVPLLVEFVAELLAEFSVALLPVALLPVALLAAELEASLLALLSVLLEALLPAAELSLLLLALSEALFDT